MPYTISTSPDHTVTVEGATDTDVQTALALLDAMRTLQADTVSVSRSALLHAIGHAGIDLVPPAALEQARKLAQLRNRLMSTPAYSYETLAEVRHEPSIASLRTWVSRRRQAHQLFTVSDPPRVVLPAFQFDEAGQLRPELAPLLSVLMSAAVDGWSLWAWLTTPSSLLSGEVPERVAVVDPARALRAAQRFTRG